MKGVSIIIPLYNAADIVRETIESALSQTYAQKQIIIVDDGSSDNSFAVATEYRSENVFVIQQPNAGAAVARNTGLRYAKGEYIQFLDAGDILSKEKIEKQVRALQGQTGKIAVCNYKQFTTQEELTNNIYPDQSHFIYTTNDTLDFLLHLWGGYDTMNFIQTNCWLIPKTLIEKAGGWRIYRCPDDDGEFFARIVLASNGVVHVPEVYNYYRITPGGGNQLSRSTNRKYLQNTLLTIDLKHQYLLNKGNHPLIDKAIASQYLRFAMDMYPAQKILSAIAFRRYQSFGIKVKQPVLGGNVIEGIKKMVGWRTARLIRYYLRER